MIQRIVRKVKATSVCFLQCCHTNKRHNGLVAVVEVEVCSPSLSEGAVGVLGDHQELLGIERTIFKTRIP